MTVKAAYRKVCAVTVMGLGMGLMTPTTSEALTFRLPDNGNIVGHVQTATVQKGDSLSTVGRRYEIGGYEMKEANPGVPYLMPKPGSQLTIPSRFVLPSGPREGIVINLAEMRIYFYHPDGQHVSTWPVGVGQQGWDTPMGTSQIVRMRKDPVWVVPKSILENHKRQGKPIEPVWPAGPKNPLGKYALNTGFKNIVIHGTPYPMGVGLRSSHGCIRMVNENVEELFSMAKIGTKVRIIHEPNKVGLADGKVYLESHLPFREAKYKMGQSSVAHTVKTALSNMGIKNADLRWNDLEGLYQRASGYPQFIGNF